MNDLVGKCGRYLWSPDIEPKNWISETDYESFISQHSLGKIYHCVDLKDNFIVISSNKKENYRVNPEGFSIVPFTHFYVGDRIKILNGSKTGKIGVISNMGWHSKKEKIIFLLKIDDKKSSRQYWEEDIESYE